MNPKRTQVAYQEAAVRNANAIELVVMLYDILTKDLHGAIQAIEAGNIEARSAKLKHGFLALQQLEGSLPLEDGGDLATDMSRFYSMLRAQMMKAQVQQDPAILRELIQLLFSVREAWVELNGRQSSPAEVPTAQTSPSAPAQLQTASWKA